MNRSRPGIRRTALRLLAIAGASTIAATTLAVSQDAPTKPAGETAPAKAEIDERSRAVLERAAKATLGEFATNRGLTSIRMTGRMVIPAQGLNAPLQMAVDAKGRQAMRIEIPGLGTMRSGISETIGWQFSELTGPVVMDEQAVAQAREQSDLYAELKWDTRATKIVFAGERDLELPDGSTRPVVTLTVTSRASGKDETHHFDREHGWRLRSDAIQAVPGMGELPLTSWYLDYRRDGDYAVPHRTIVSVGPNSQEIIIESIEINPELDDATFAVPDEVKAIAGR